MVGLVLENQEFFVLGLQIQSRTKGRAYVASMVSLSSQNFSRVDSLCDTAGRESEPPYFGWPNTLLPVYRSTLNLWRFLRPEPAQT
jgi:hypothetical protein